MTSSSSRGPSRDWLNIVKTSEAKTKIRAWLKREERETNIPLGHDMLEKEAKRLGYTLSHLLRGDAEDMIIKRFSAQTLDDVYAMVGFGGLSCAQVVNRLVDEYKKNNKADEAAANLPEITRTEDPQPKRQAQSSSNGVIVKGESGMLVRFARCCSPLPGDSIVGYVTRGRGVSVHRSDCISLKDPEMEKSRLIDVEWEAQGTNATYEADLRIITYNRTGLLAEISVMLATQEVPVGSISGHANKDSTYVFNVTLIIKNTQQLGKIIRDLQKHPDVIEVSRINA
jgi:GTP pyrophosphokinase